MASKYDEFWRVRLDIIEDKLNEVAAGNAPQLSIYVSELTSWSNRAKTGWSASVCVQNGQAESRGNAAHMNSLARLLNEKALKRRSPARVRLSIKGAPTGAPTATRPRSRGPTPIGRAGAGGSW